MKRQNINEQARGMYNNADKANGSISNFGSRIKEGGEKKSAWSWFGKKGGNRE
jgi:hypothetical protein